MDKQDLLRSIQTEHLPYKPLKKTWSGISGVMKCLLVFLIVHLVLAIPTTIIYILTDNDLRMMMAYASFTSDFLFELLIFTPLGMLILARYFRGMKVEDFSPTSDEIFIMELVERMASRGAIFIIVNVILSILITIYIRTLINNSIERANDSIIKENNKIALKNKRIDQRNQERLRKFYKGRL